MTNRELLRAPSEALGPVDRQRQFVLTAELTPVPCPACQAPIDSIAAAGLTIDQYDFGRTTPTYRCPHCTAVLERVVPVVAVGPGWSWQLHRDWLAERLAKARAYDRDRGLKEGRS